MKLAQNALAIGLALLAALIGAFYLSAQNSLAAPGGGVVTICDDAHLRAALAGGGTVTFACGANPLTITVTSLLNITSTTTVDGGGKITLSGGHTNGVFLVQSGVPLTLMNITLADGKGAFGGCVTAFGPVTTVQATLRDCHSITGFLSGDGGALAILNANLSMSNTQVLNNRADVNGGGLFIYGGSHTLDHVTISGNRVDITETDSGGGIYVTNNALLTIQNSQIDNNIFGYKGLGGGIAALSSTLQLVNVSLNNNLGEGASLGGGLYLQSATANLYTVTVAGNTEDYAGSGIDSEDSNLTIVNSSISGNVASSNGAGINTYLGSLNLSSVVVNGNAANDGAGIDLYNTPATLDQSTVSNNRGGRDGAGINNYLGTLTLNNSTVSGNINDGSAVVGGQGSGGGIYNESGSLLINSSTLNNNSSSGQAGGIYNQAGSTSILTNTTVSANVAITGGGIYNEPSSSNYTVYTLTNVTLKDNRAAAGGGIYNENGLYDFIFLKNTIIADSLGGGNCRGKAITFAKYSLSSDGTCGLLIADGNKNNTPAQLFPLGNYGGPTQTHLPAQTSPALNGVGGTDCPSNDQRGVLRPQGGACDIGSVERQGGDPLRAPWLYLPLIINHH